MQDKKKQKNKKGKKAPGLLETIKKVNDSEELKNQERLEKKNDAEREKYGKKVAKEKIEVLKLKQGVADDYAVLAGDVQEKRNYTFGSKVGNFIYHHKWWLGIALFMALLLGYLIYDALSKDEPDINVLFLSNDTVLQEHVPDIKKYFDDIIDDYNDDDIKCAEVINIPLTADTKNETGYYGYNISLDRLTNVLNLGSSMLILGDAASDEYIAPDKTLENLSVIFPDLSFVDGSKLFLKDTAFAEKIGLSSEDIPDDLYLGLRKIIPNGFASEDSLRPVYERSLATLKKVARNINTQS